MLIKSLLNQQPFNIQQMIKEESRPTVTLQAPVFEKSSLISVISKTQPYRKGGIRLQHEQINGKHLFHNYGHGSSGISLAYGSAFMSVKSVHTFVNVDHPIDCAIVGSGLIALLTAIQLAKVGFTATIYSDRFAKFGQTDISKKMASQVDEGLWLPFGYDMKDRLRHELLSKISFDYYKECLKTKRYQSFKTSTVYEKDATIAELKQRTPGFLYNGYKQVALNLGNGPEDYIRMKTIKIDSELFLEELRVEATLRGIKFVERTFKNMEDFLKLNQQCVFNCTGSASRILFDDKNIEAIRDHLIIFANKTKLNYTLSAKLRNGQHMRVHCYKGHIILRSETPVEEKSESFVQKLINQANLFFKNKGTTAKL